MWTSSYNGARTATNRRARRNGGARQKLATVSELCSLDWDTWGTGLVVGWRWSPWCRACSSSSTASTKIAGGLSMSRLSAVLLRVGCSDGPANIFWPENESRAPRKIGATSPTTQNCRQMIPFRSRSDSWTFSLEQPATGIETNFSRCPQPLRPEVPIPLDARLR